MRYGPKAVCNTGCRSAELNLALLAPGAVVAAMSAPMTVAGRLAPRTARRGRAARLRRRSSWLSTDCSTAPSSTRLTTWRAPLSRPGSASGTIYCWLRHQPDADCLFAKCLDVRPCVLGRAAQQIAGRGDRDRARNRARLRHRHRAAVAQLTGRAASRRLRGADPQRLRQSRSSPISPMFWSPAPSCRSKDHAHDSFHVLVSMSWFPCPGFHVLRYFFNVWDSFEFNSFARITDEAVGPAELSAAGGGL
jgi:hypothetical protein